LKLMIGIVILRERKAQNNPEIYAPIEKSNKSFLQAVAISCKTPFSEQKATPAYVRPDPDARFLLMHE
jgi:hypothetical protein